MPRKPDRLLPNSIDTERLMLGAILLNSTTIGSTVADTLTDEDFSYQPHKFIYAALGAIRERGEIPDRIVLANELSRRGTLEAVGGLSGLLGLDENLPDLISVDGFIRILKDKSGLRRLIRSAMTMEEQAYSGNFTAAEIATGTAKQIEAVQTGALPLSPFQQPKDVIDAFPGGIDSFLDPTKRIKGLGTGFSAFDELTSGLHPGELIILAARPSMGKTSLALNIAQYVATHPKMRKPVAVFSLEMSSSSLLNRMICASARVDAHKFRAGFLNQDERRKLQLALSYIYEAPLFLDDTPGINIQEIHTKLRRLKEAHGLALVVIDYIQLLGSRGRSENRNQEVSAISRGLKLMAKDLDVPFLALSQLNRAVEIRTGKHKPQLSDLRESGSLEQDADLVAFIWREEIYAPDREDVMGLADLIIAKQRNGPIGTVHLRFLGQYTRFESRADDLPEEPLEPPAQSFHDTESW